MSPTADKPKKIRGKGEKKSTSDKFFCKKCGKLISKKKRRRHRERCGIKPHRHRGKGGSPILLTPDMMRKFREQMMQSQLPPNVDSVEVVNKSKSPVLLTTPFHVHKKEDKKDEAQS